MNTKVLSSLMDENLLTKKHVDWSESTFAKWGHSIIQPSVWLNFLCKMKCFSKLIKKYSTQQSENLFFVTMQITMETVHIGGIQTGQFGNVYIQTWPPTSPSPGVSVIIGHGNWILGPRITIRRQLSPPHKYWSSRGRWLDRGLISTD